MPSPAEKLILLRSASIFTETPDDALVEIAPLLEEVELKTGETIFEKGDLGTSMYIIVDGCIRVHDEGHTLNELGRWDIFGEMAALDPEPRSASIVAVEDTHLFRLDREPLLRLMTARPEIAHGVIQILCRQLRARVKDVADDWRYIQQVGRVAAAAAAVEAGVYEPASLDEVARRPDELGHLARVFQHMAREVYAREQRLKQEVQQLRIEIDEARTAHQVAEITETDYFRELQNKVDQLRLNSGVDR